VLLDIRMPELSGFEIARTLLSKGKDAPLIAAVTG